MRDFSNYHDISLKEKIAHDSLFLLEKSLEGWEGYEVLINNEKESQIIVYQKWDANSQIKKVIGRKEDIEIGNLMKIDKYNWLVITFPEDNKVYKKAEIRLCNSIFLIETDKTYDVLKDENGNVVYDKYGNPVLIEIGGGTFEEPCIVEQKYYFNNRNEQITLPEDRILVTMRYQKANNIEVNKEFDMYNSRFAIKDIDYTKVINGVGIMTLIGERVMNK